MSLKKVKVDVWHIPLTYMEKTTHQQHSKMGNRGIKNKSRQVLNVKD